jgi:hypothetical protein
MFRKWLLALVLAAGAGFGSLFLPQKADAQIFPRVRARMYWGPPAVRYYDGWGYGGGYYRPYWGPYGGPYRWWYPY